jgi:hypothetical protein
LDPGVVNEDIGPAEPLGGIVQNFRSVWIDKIAAERTHLYSGARHGTLGGNLCQRAQIARHEQQIGARGRQMKRASPPETTARSGHNRQH